MPEDRLVHATVRWQVPRYVSEFAGRHNIRDLDTMNQMIHVAAAMVGWRLMYRDLVGGERGCAT